MRILSIIAAFFVAGCIYAQDYFPFLPNKVAYYQKTQFQNDTNSNVVCLKVDSSYMNYAVSEKAYTFLSEKDILNDETIVPQGYSWFGTDAIHFENNEEIVLRNKYGEPIFIKYGAKVGESWNIYDLNQKSILDYVLTPLNNLEDRNGILPFVSMEATVSKIDTLTFLGVTDSVKYIKLKVLPYGQIPSVLIFDQTIILSKHYGFVECYNFKMFPNVFPPENSNLDELQKMKLVGVSDITNSVNNITKFDVYDFKPGDEIHTFTEYYDSLKFEPEVSYTYYKTIQKVISRTDYADSIIYSVLKQENKFIRLNNDIKDTVYQDTVKLKIVCNSRFDTLPGPMWFEGENTAYNNYTMLLKDTNIIKVSQYDNAFYSKKSDGWESDFIYDAGPYIPIYDIKGLGGGYFDNTLGEQDLWAVFTGQKKTYVL